MAILTIGGEIAIFFFLQKASNVYFHNRWGFYAKNNLQKPLNG